MRKFAATPAREAAPHRSVRESQAGALDQTAAGAGPVRVRDHARRALPAVRLGEPARAVWRRATRATRATRARGQPARYTTTF